MLKCFNFILIQVSWISHDDSSLSNVSRISLNEYNCSANLFTCSETSDIFCQLSENVGKFYPFQRSDNGLVANMILFHSDDSESLTDRKKVLNFFEKAKSLLRSGTESGPTDVEPLIRTLVKMRNIFEKKVLLVP
jgi:hypothetical protein